jgi:NADH-quinone oxidoreductase subunit E
MDIEEGGTTKDGMFSLNFVACLGCCSLAPVMMVNGEVHGRLNPEKAVDILESYRAGDREDE